MEEKNTKRIKEINKEIEEELIGIMESGGEIEKDDSISSPYTKYLLVMTIILYVVIVIKVYFMIVKLIH